VESLSEYLSQLASTNPTPGGGSAATIVAAIGAALISMASRISASNPKYAAHKELADRLATRADALRDQLIEARFRDEAAYAAVVKTLALPRSTEEERVAREERLRKDLKEAAAAPLEGAHFALEIERLAAFGVEIGNRNLASDLGCAAEFAAAAVAACAYNVRINHRFMNNQPETVTQQAEQLERCEQESAALLADVRRAVAAAMQG